MCCPFHVVSLENYDLKKSHSFDMIKREKGAVLETTFLKVVYQSQNYFANQIPLFSLP